MQHSDQSDVHIYRAEDGQTRLTVRLDHETVWLTQKQMAGLFDKNVRTVNEHIKNIFKEGELEKPSVIRKFRITASDGKSYVTAHYSLDVIISVGYRIKSRRGTQFRQWATKVLREHLVKGYTINEQRLREQSEKLEDLHNTVALLEKTLAGQPIGLDEVKGLLRVITDYAYALTTLDRYDHGTLSIDGTSGPAAYSLDYAEAIAVVQSMKTDFEGLFGLEKDQGFKSAIGAIYQTFDGKDVYLSVEEKAANLLYFIVKNHAFTDGNKRIAAALFIYFLAGNCILYRADGSKRLADNALVALTLLIARVARKRKTPLLKLSST